MNRVKNIGWIAAFSLAGLFATACTGQSAAIYQPKTRVTVGPRIEFKLEPGPYYAKNMGILWFKYTVRPQIAVWIETPEGRFLDTLYVTEVAVTGKYRSAPKQGRPEALPVWSARKAGSADAVSAPTTVGSAVVFGNGIASRLSAGKYTVMLEANRSYDYNETFTKKNSGVNGQPSIIYRAELEIGFGPREARFEPLGTGSVDGSNGTIKPGLEGIDTALELFSSMTVRYLVD